MHRATLNHPGDVLLAWKELDITDPAERAAVAAMLGYGITPATSSTAQPTPTETRNREDRPKKTNGRKMCSGKKNAVPLPPRSISPGVPDETWLRELERQSPQPGSGNMTVSVAGKLDLSGTRPLDLAGGGRAGAPPPLPMLLRPAWQRAVVNELLGTTQLRGDVDIDALVNRLADAVPILRLPRLPVMSLDRGAQVLVDVGPSMQPFHADQASLLLELHKLIPEHQLQVLEFETFPGAGVRQWRTFPPTQFAYRPPDDGRPVLLLSDLGVRWNGQGGPTRRDWRRFVAAIQRGGSELIALSPHAIDRVDPWLRSILTIVPWAEQTGAALTRRRRRAAAHRRLGVAMAASTAAEGAS